MAQSWYQSLWEHKKEVSLLLFLGGVLIYFIIRFQPAPTPPSSFSARTTLELKDIVVHDYKKEQKRWLLKGKQAVVLEGNKELQIQKVRLWMYAINPNPDQEPVVSVEIQAENGTVYSDRIELSGEVQVFKESEQMTLFTQKASYNTQTSQLILPGVVTIIRPHQRFLGEALNYNVSKQSWKMKKVSFSE